MKKSLIFLFLSALTLTGCSNEITPDEAENVANDIKTYRANIDSISELKVKCKYSYHYNGTSNRELINEKEEVSYTYELSSKFNYIHISSTSSDEDKVGETSNKEEEEQWYYMKRKVLYKVNRRKFKGSETKTYSKVEKYSEAIKEFSNTFDSIMPKAYKVARGEEFLDIDNFEKYFDEKYVSGMNYGAKFYSSGSGNLRVVGAATLKENENNNGKASGVGALTCKWKKYLLSSASLSLTASTSDGTNKNDMKLTVSISEKVNNFFIPTYPKLSNYAEGSSLPLYYF